jgi:hypothetical protein
MREHDMAFAFVNRWLSWHREPLGTAIELACGGRVAARQTDGGLVLAITTPPDAEGRSHTAAVPLSIAERLELSQVLEVENPWRRNGNRPSPVDGHVERTTS